MTVVAVATMLAVTVTVMDMPVLIIVMTMVIVVILAVVAFPPMAMLLNLAGLLALSLTHRTSTTFRVGGHPYDQHTSQQTSSCSPEISLVVIHI
jgi:hypothetical protein